MDAGAVLDRPTPDELATARAVLEGAVVVGPISGAAGTGRLPGLLDELALLTCLLDGPGWSPPVLR